MTARHGPRLTQARGYEMGFFDTHCGVHFGGYAPCILKPGHDGKHRDANMHSFDLPEGDRGYFEGDTVPLGSPDHPSHDASDVRYARAQARAQARAEELAGLPPYTYGTAVDGHRYHYNVIGRYSDGTPQTSSWDAVHQDDCRCSDPESWH